MNVTDIIYRGNGMTVTFDDGSVANCEYKVMNNELNIIGLNDRQK